MKSKKLVWLVTAGVAAGILMAPAGSASRANRHVWEKPSLVSNTLAHRETSLAVDPTDASHLFICDPSGVPNTQYNQSYFHASSDAGKTWK
ncbi:MAG: hypothetical protein M3290_05645, partial [Actinomycetota bacterium]|nr:hypothetical protein [Actinomycetota bacterium]